MSTNIQLFIDELEALKIPFKKDEPMKNHTTFKIGGNTPAFIEPVSTEQIKIIVNLSKKYSVKILCVGRGSNMLISDSGIDMAVIHFGENFNKITKDENSINVLSGATLISLCNFAKENSLAGLEFAYGIPATVGGAVYMNAGAYGGEISNVIKSVTYLDEDGEIHTKAKEELDYSYRHSYFKNKNCIILSTDIALSDGNKDEISALMDDYMNRRKTKQPLNYPSAGSTFKRPEGAFASALIDRCGLKGYSVGDAQVSEKHAGFVINKGSATANEVKQLMEDVKKIVFEKTGFTLEPEIIVL